ncbi:LysR family transcriptional regulator [Paraburkholderia sp. MPAMCS5]|uniref:LysR family transcriptional regulator n=1 Tax=Paraburkholderia sp. MPAMCS5 TaxID=3112563 RepID=UPI002E17EE82|nr:LysR family transcriptional regulator [Paraburkholderia sp. MPAMCS5]
MDQRQIDIFIAVMRLGSVTAAAEALSISQPSVSKTIALSERRLGFALFERVKGRLEPTPEASLVFDEALRLHENVARFERFLGSVRDFRAGQVRVAATPALAIAMLPMVAKRFRANFPDYGLVLDMQLNHEIPQSVEHEEYDVGLLVIPTADETEDMHIVSRGEFICVLPINHPLGQSDIVQWNDVRSLQLIHITTDRRIVDLMTGGIPGFGNRVSSSIESNRYTVAVNLVGQGLGFTLVDEFALIGHPLESIEIRRFRPSIKISLVAVVGKRHSRTRAAMKFVETIKEVVSESRPRIPQT